jgi:hypothetical protein
MAETTAAPNNKPVNFGGKTEGEAVAKPKVIKPKMAKATRKKASRAIKRGMISEKAAKRHLGDY